jgi:hypothetical protein
MPDDAYFYGDPGPGNTVAKFKDGSLTPELIADYDHFTVGLA